MHEEEFAVSRDREAVTVGIKVKNPRYSQLEGREELFETAVTSERCPNSLSNFNVHLTRSNCQEDRGNNEIP